MFPLLYYVVVILSVFSLSVLLWSILLGRFLCARLYYFRFCLWCSVLVGQVPFVSVMIFVRISFMLVCVASFVYWFAFILCSSRYCYLMFCYALFVPLIALPVISSCCFFFLGWFFPLAYSTSCSVNFFVFCFLSVLFASWLFFSPQFLVMSCRFLSFLIGSVRYIFWLLFIVLPFLSFSFSYDPLFVVMLCFCSALSFHTRFHSVLFRYGLRCSFIFMSAHLLSLLSRDDYVLFFYYLSVYCMFVVVFSITLSSVFLLLISVVSFLVFSCPCFRSFCVVYALFFFCSFVVTPFMFVLFLWCSARFVYVLWLSFRFCHAPSVSFSFFSFLLCPFRLASLFSHDYSMFVFAFSVVIFHSFYVISCYFIVLVCSFHVFTFREFLFCSFVFHFLYLFSTFSVSLFWIDYPILSFLFQFIVFHYFMVSSFSSFSLIRFACLGFLLHDIVLSVVFSGTLFSELTCSFVFYLMFSSSLSSLSFVFVCCYFPFFFFSLRERLFHIFHWSSLFCYFVICYVLSFYSYFLRCLCHCSVMFLHCPFFCMFRVFYVSFCFVSCLFLSFLSV